MNHYRIMLDGKVKEISLQEYNRLHNINLHRHPAQNTYMVIEKSKKHINVMKYGWVPDIPIKALKEILKDD